MIRFCMTKFNFLWLIYRSLANGRLIAAKHLVITNSSNTRHNVVYFVNPTKESLIEPAKPLISLTSPVFRSMTFGEVWGNFFYQRLTIWRRIAPNKLPKNNGKGMKPLQTYFHDYTNLYCAWKNEVYAMSNDMNYIV